MSTPWQRRAWPWLAALALAGTSAEAWAQARYQQVDEEPRWLRLNINQVSTGVYAEGEYDTASFKNSSTTSSHDRVFVGPSLGLNMDGSIYHPSLLQYSLGGEGAFGWVSDHVSSGRTSTQHNETDFLGYFYGTANILQSFPVNGSIYGGYDHSFRDYGYLNWVAVDTWRYGARAGWTHGPFSVLANYTHRDEEISALSGVSASHQDALALNAQDLRARGQTTLNYVFTQYSRVDYDLPTSGTDHVVTLSDNERFGSHDQYKLDSSLSAARHDFSIEPSSELAANANLWIEHTPTFSTSYDVLYDQYSTGGLTSDSIAADATLNHQLYNNLSEALFVHGSDYETSGAVGSGSSRRYGVGLTLNYFRNLDSGTQLTLNNSVVLDHVDQQNINSVHSEPHSFVGGTGGAGPNAFFLNLPDVKWPTIVVWRPDHTQRFVRGIDYRLTLNGAITQVERIFGSLMPDNVVVDYDTEPTPGGSYELLAETFGVRLTLFQNLWGIYGRVLLSKNNAAEALRIPDFTGYVVGSDLTWRWLRVGGEYNLYDSTVSSYRVARLFQSFQFQLDSASTLGIEFAESSTDYISAQRREQDFLAMLQFHRTLSRQLSVNVQAGYNLRRGVGVDQDLASVIADFDYWFGQFNLKAGYYFEQDAYLNTEFRSRHVFLLRLKRYF